MRHNVSSEERVQPKGFVSSQCQFEIKRSFLEDVTAVISANQIHLAEQLGQQLTARLRNAW